MFPQLRERIGPALDLIVEFSTLGEYRLNADGVLCAASALTPVPRKRSARPGAQRSDSRKRPARPGAQRWAPEREPQMGGAGAPQPEAAGRADCAGYGTAARAAVRRIVAGGAAGSVPAATPAARRPPLEPNAALRRPACDGRSAGLRRRACGGEPAVHEQLCLAV